ncbi:MAG: HupE/UreJ family protein [Pseudomonadota bacterium]
MIRWLLAALLGLIAQGVCNSASGHEVRPAYLEVVEIAAGEHTVVWKQPISDGRRLRIDPIFPDACNPGAEQVSNLGGALLRRWSLSCDLTSGSIRVDGLDRTLTDVFVRITDLSGETRAAVLRPAASVFDLAGPAAAATVAYFQIGVEHIWFGWDHLLFVLGIMLLVERRQLLLTITAFTVAHSITLGLSAIGGISLPGPPVEIVIALSIALLGLEVIHKQRGGLSLAARRPWLVAGLFGLIHGFGFAGALAEIGLPKQAEVLALLLFNVGVEAGQLAIIAAVLIGVWAMSRLQLIAGSTAYASRFAGAYALGIIGMYWAIERSYDTLLIG